MEPANIESEKFLKQKTKYIYENPVRKGLVENPEDWLYSSARNRLADKNDIIELD